MVNPLRRDRRQKRRCGIPQHLVQGLEGALAAFCLIPETILPRLTIDKAGGGCLAQSQHPSAEKGSKEQHIGTQRILQHKSMGLVSLQSFGGADVMRTIAGQKAFAVGV